MNTIQFRKAEQSDLVEVHKLFNLAIKNMYNNGIDQWDELYPTQDIFMADITNNQMYVGTINNQIAVVYTLNEESDEDYKNGNWEFTNSKFCIIHRLCVNPQFQKQGIATLTLNHIENECKTLGYTSIRLDSFTKNPYSKKLYDSNGYKVTGFTHWRKGDFFLREKKI